MPAKQTSFSIHLSLPAACFIFVPMYHALRNVLFFFPTEGVHYFSMNTFSLISKVPAIRNYLVNQYKIQRPELSRNLFGLDFPNPVGLGAGFDKNAHYLQELQMLGFGFVEIGTVTPKPQNGNPGPRLFRLPKDKALINRMGFNNDGAVQIAARLASFHYNYNPKNKLIIGGNIGKNKDTPNELAYKDYLSCFQTLADYVDYFVINVSSPNTPGLRALQEKESLRTIFNHLQSANNKKVKSKPLLIKISPDLNRHQLQDILDLATEIKLDGLVVSNTTIDRENLITPNHKVESIGAGGLSGLPLFTRSTALVDTIRNEMGSNLPIIASGGIFGSLHANAKFHVGADLIQVWTGFIYEGPGIVKKICNKL